jgi:ABC-type branched-subunit amino acid transport system substrate-binding protein
MNAIQKAGSTDKQAIIDVLHKEAVPGVLIPEYRFSETGDVVGAPMFVYTVENGEFTLVERFEE